MLLMHNGRLRALYLFLSQLRLYKKSILEKVYYNLFFAKSYAYKSFKYKYWFVHFFETRNSFKYIWYEKIYEI